MFDVIVAVYNKRLSDVKVLNWLEAEPRIEKVIVCDNSDQIINTSNDVDDLSKIVYVDMKGNQGLSKAYNRALSFARADFVCIMDDDTLFSESYFADVEKQISNECADIYVPVVREDGVIFSPCLRNGYRFSPLPSLDMLDGRPYSAINSGTVIRRLTVGSNPYDENLFLDFVDHRFISDSLERGLTVFVMKDVSIDQQFSFNSTVQVRSRYEIFKKDSKEFYSGSLSGRMFRLLLLIRRRRRTKHA